MNNTSFRDRIKGLRSVHASDLIPHPMNWRRHPESQREALRGVLSEVGIVDVPICRELPDGRLQLLDGHLRQELLGDAEISVLVIDIANDAEAAKVLATLDPIAAMAEASTKDLDQILRMVDTGSAAVQEMLAELADSAGLYHDEKKEVEEDDPPEPPVEPITKPGDLWLLGDHRLLCGDSTKAEDVERLMAGAKADLCFTSPPYGQQRDYTEEGKAKVADWDGLMRGVFGNLPMADAGQVLVNLGLIHRDGEWIPYWDGWIAWMREQGWNRFGWYVWDKGHPMPGSSNGRLLPQHEFVFHFCATPVEPQPTIEKQGSGKRATWFGARRKDGTHNKQERQIEASGYRVSGSVVCVYPEEDRQEDSTHPAVFPVRLAGEFLSMWPGAVYEPFCGSGTTLIAAEQLGRKCYGMEISPAYCDVIVKRWETLTGSKAVLENTTA